MGWLNNDWIISLTSIVIGVIVTPALLAGWNWIRSRKGKLTGQYLSISQVNERGRLLIDQIEVRHVGKHLYGKITSRVEFTIGDQDWAEDLTGAQAGYKFTAELRERRALLAYWSTAVGSANSGTMTLQLEDDGSMMRGIWSGPSSDGQLTSFPCMWYRYFSDLAAKDPAGVTDAAVGLLRALDNPWREPDQPMHLSKMRFYMAAVQAATEAADEGDSDRSAQ